MQFLFFFVVVVAVVCFLFQVGFVFWYLCCCCCCCCCFIVFILFVINEIYWKYIFFTDGLTILIAFSLDFDLISLPLALLYNYRFVRAFILASYFCCLLKLLFMYMENMKNEWTKKVNITKIKLKLIGKERFLEETTKE